MKKILSLVATVAIFFAMSSCSAALSKTGVLIVAPVEYKTQDFLKIATEQFGKEYNISQGLQDDWATYCWDKGYEVSDPMVSKETLADFAKTTYFDKIIFVVFKNIAVSEENLGTDVTYYGFGVLDKRDKVIRRSNIEARIVIMNNEGETLKIFEEAHTDASKTSMLRANRGAFEGLCKNIAQRLNNKGDKTK